MQFGSRELFDHEFEMPSSDLGTEAVESTQQGDLEARAGSFHDDH
jgi:hypothetical protein